MKYFNALLLLLSSTISMAAASRGQIPSMQELLSYQTSCNPEALNRMDWAREPGFGHMTSKVWAVVSDLKVQELAPGKGAAPSRRFEVTFKAWKSVYCHNGIPKKLPQNLPLQKKTILELSYNNDQENRGLILNTNNPELSEDDFPFARFLITAPPGDSSSEDSHDKLACLIDKDEFVQGKAQIDFERLCEGATAAQRRSTESYLQWLKKALK